MDRAESRFSGLWKTEDWWAVWVGTILFVFTPLVLRVPKPEVWKSNPVESVTPEMLPPLLLLLLGIGAAVLIAVAAMRERPGRFLAAFRSGASERNVQVRLDIEGPDGVRVGVVQITGLIARRIVCYPSVGGTLERGEPYGLICYGSRMEVYVPIESEICVRLGDRVRGGETVIAEVRA